MLLRRITHHVKTQNWFAVFVDFVIVVVGVFIGIQVANWNEERAERVLEQEYLERIYFDTVRVISDLDENIAWSEDQGNAQVVIIDSLLDKQLEQNDEELFQRGLAFFGYFPIDDTDLIAVNELQSSGRMSIINNIELRELIGLTLQKIKVNQMHNKHVKEIRRKHLNIISSQWRFLESDLEANGITKINYDFETLANNREFINRLSQMKVMFQIQRRNAEEDKVDIQKLQASIIKVLGYTPEK